MKNLHFCWLIIAFWGPASLSFADWSNIKSDETVVFFNTDAHLDSATDEWVVPIHGWVFELDRAWLRKKSFAAIVRTLYGFALDEISEDIFSRRTGLLIADNERNKRVVVRLAGQVFELPPSEGNGHFYQEVRLSSQALEGSRHFSAPEPSAPKAAAEKLQFQAVLKPGDNRLFEGESRLVPPGGVSVISDIDDTVKITDVTDTAAMINATFYQPFEAAPGMSNVYQHWVEHNKTLHFISSSPWQLYPELSRFLSQQGFPWASYYLKKVRFRDTTFFNLFKSSTITKPQQIEALLERYPQREFILVGDSGEHDPEVYVQIQQSHPHRIRQIFIRNVTNETLTNARMAPLTRTLSNNCLILFEDTAALYKSNAACIAH